MPSFTIDGRQYHSTVEYALEQIGGRWKLPILWRLRDAPMRYTELQRNISGLTTKMLTSQLRELEASGLIQRKVFAEVPPRVEYTLTDKGQMVIPIINHLRVLGDVWLDKAELNK